MASSRAFAATLMVISGALAGCGSSDGELRGEASSIGAAARTDEVRVPRSGGGSGRCASRRAPAPPRGRTRRPPARDTGLEHEIEGADPRHFTAPADRRAKGCSSSAKHGSEPGLVLVAPGSLGSTWSALHDREDRDLETVNRALAETWRRCRIDPRRVAVGGFSDGATHALSIGLQNGGIFRSVMALSPGGLLDVAHRGNPRMFIAHGTGDDVLPYARTRTSASCPCSRDRGTVSPSGASPVATRYRRASRARPSAGTCASSRRGGKPSPDVVRRARTRPSLASHP